MPNSGFLNPVSAFTVSAARAGNPNRPWVSGGNTGSLFSAARVSDNLRAIVDDISAAVIPFPFYAQFNITALASAQGFEVQGFTVRYERRRNSTALSVNETWIQFISGAGAGVQFLGTTANSDTGNWSTTEAYVTAGGSGSMFGLTTADASAGRFKTGRIGFAVNIRYGTGTTLTSAYASIDHMQLQVHYAALTMDVQSSEYGREWGSVGPLVPIYNITVVSPEFRYSVNGALQSTSYVSAASSALNHGSVATDWTTPAQVTAADGVYASAEASASTDILVARFDWLAGHPSETPISAVRMIVSARTSSVGTAPLVLRIGNVSAGGNSNASYDTFPSAATETGYSAAWASADNATFAQYLSAAAIVRPERSFEAISNDDGTYQVDRIRLEVQYRGESNGNITITQTGGAASTDVFSGEWDWASTSLPVTKNIVAQSGEYDWEGQSLAIAQQHALTVTTGEWDWEGQSLAVAKNLAVVAAEFDWEAASIALAQQNAVTPASGEWDWEAASLAATKNLIVVSGEWDYESGSAAVAQGGTNLVVTTSEFDWEGQSLDLTKNLVVASGEWDWAAESVAVSRNLIVVSGEWDWGADSVAIARNIVAASGEWGWEGSSAGITQLHALAPASGEWDHEIGAVTLARNVQPGHAEFDWEGRSLALEIVVRPLSGEWGWEAESVALTKNVAVASGEWDWEGTSAFISSKLTVNEFERGWEAASVTLTKVVRPVTAEFANEWASIAISKVLGVVGSEYGWEARSASLTRNAAVLEAEFDWEATSLDLNQLYTVSAGAIGAPEFDWEAGGVRLRFFPRPALTPRERIKYARNYDLP